MEHTESIWVCVTTGVARFPVLKSGDSLQSSVVRARRLAHVNVYLADFGTLARLSSFVDR